ncbi:MAG TPA: hypothetical protein VNO14_05555 [Blastocatellia bacterium]|nr:hypothetical protein [Blastocatellia bacterium]
MKEEAITDDLLARYALGRLSEQEQERVEERIFTDRALFERLLAVEDDLVDAYAGGRLTVDERERFERYFLKSKEDGERVGFARELAAYVSRESKPPVSKETRSRQARWPELLRFRNPLILVPLAATLLIAVGALWLALQTVRLNDRLDELRAEREAQQKREQELEAQVAAERSRNEQLLAELEREQAQQELEASGSQPAAPGFLSFILTADAVRDRGAGTRLAIPPGVERVRLQALFKAGEYPSYRAELQTVEGRAIYERAGLRSRKRGDDLAVTLFVPASLFGEDDYILILSGITPSGEEESVGEYYFRVTRK